MLVRSAISSILSGNVRTFWAFNVDCPHGPYDLPTVASNGMEIDLDRIRTAFPVSGILTRNYESGVYLMYQKQYLVVHDPK